MSQNSSKKKEMSDLSLNENKKQSKTKINLLGPVAQLVRAVHS